ncbi:MAG: GNAT family N-acetyltransferase [Thermoplasmata archaeon]|nr:MAG: GNAT family N-acetyltransferase [Thermoplasmata archaeon]
MINIRKIESEDDIEIVRDLILEYGRIRNFDAAMGDYKKELAELPGEYSLPHGCLLIAFYDDEPVGCVAIRKINDDFCEMKRLYVKPRFRGKKIGKALVLELISEACEIGYKFMRLDNHPWMIEAESLYKSVGFKEIEAYRFNPIEGAKFFELDLRKYVPN